MRYKEIRSMEELINVALQGAPKHTKKTQWIMEAWYTIRPDTQGKIQRSFVKGQALYLKLHAPALRHQLYLQRVQIQRDLQEAIEQRGGEGSLIKQIFFIWVLIVRPLKHRNL